MVASPAQAAPSDFLTISDAGNWDGVGQHVRFKVSYSGTTDASFDFAIQNGSGTHPTATTDFHATTPLVSPYFNSGTETISFLAASASAPATATVDAVLTGTVDPTDETFQLEATPNTPSSGPVVDGNGTIWKVATPTPPTVSFTAPNTVPEAAGSVTVTANLTATAAHDITIPVSTVDATTHSPVATSMGGATRDYTAIPANTTITVPAGQLTGTINVGINDDNVYEGALPQYFKVTSGGNIAGAATGTVSTEIGIVDNDPVPSVRIGNASAVTEGSNAIFPIMLSNLSESPVTVDFATAVDSDTTTTRAATPTADYTTTSVPGLTIPPYNLTYNQSVVTGTDSVLEGPETFKGTLSNPGGATLGTPTSAIATIDDDASQVAAVASADSDLAGHPADFDEGISGERATYITVTGTAPAPSSHREVPILIDYKFTDITATNGVDYRGTNGTLTIPVGVTGAFTAQIPVTIIGDTLFEGGVGSGETFKVTLSSSNSTVDPTDLIDYTYTIDDAADDQMPTWTTQNVTVAEGNSGTTMAKIPVTLSKSTSQDVTFNATFDPTLATATEGGVNAGATVGDNDFDYPTTSSVTVAAGSTTGYLQVPINGDTVYERDETFKVTFATGSTYVDSAPSNSLLTSSIVTISNDDAAPVMTFNESSGSEGTSLQLRGTLVGVSQYPYTLKFTTAGSGAAPNAATPVDDYDSAAITTTTTTGIPAINVTRGQTGALTAALATVFLNSDSIDEPTEAFGVTATESTPVPTGFATSTGIYKITDDPGDLPPVTSIQDESIGEKEKSVDVHVNLAFTGDTTATTQTVTIPYWTQDGAAKAGVNYKETKGTLSVPPGTMTATINVPIMDDKTKTTNKDFFVKLGQPGPAGAALGKSVSQVLIKDSGTGGTTPPSTGLTIKAPAWVTGSVAVPITGKADAGATVDLWGGAWSPAMPKLMKIASTKADSSGNYKFSRWIGTGYRFQVASDGDMSAVAKVGINQAPVFVASSPSKGKLSVAVQGNPRGPKQAVVVQAWVGGKWVNTWKGMTGTDNLWKATVSEKSKSSWTLRAYVAGDSTWGINAGYSAAKKVTIK